MFLLKVNSNAILSHGLELNSIIPRFGLFLQPFRKKSGVIFGAFGEVLAEVLTKCHTETSQIDVFNDFSVAHLVRYFSA